MDAADGGARAPVRASSPARSATTRCPSSSRACSRSTRRSAPARPATASAMTTVFDPERVVAFPSLSLASGAVKGWDRRNAYTFSLLESVASHYGFDLDTPFEDLPPRRAQVLLHGSGDGGDRVRLPGRRRARQAAAHGQAPASVRRHPAQPRAALPRDRFGGGARGAGALPERASPAPTAHGTRLRARGAQRLPGRRRRAASRRADLTRSSTSRWREALAYFEAPAAAGAKAEIADKVIREIRSRLKFLNDVGLNYLSLDRSAETLSGGEAQRIRLASQIGSGLTGVMYVLDEPQHRPAPARQRAPDRHAAAPARHRQQRARGRARRGHDPRRRPRASTWARAPASTAGGSWRRARPSEVAAQRRSR